MAQAALSAGLFTALITAGIIHEEEATKHLRALEVGFAHNETARMIIEGVRHVVEADAKDRAEHAKPPPPVGSS
jgi:hypothetical protein